MITYSFPSATEGPKLHYKHPSRVSASFNHHKHAYMKNICQKTWMRNFHWIIKRYLSQLVIQIYKQNCFWVLTLQVLLSHSCKPCSPGVPLHPSMVILDFWITHACILPYNNNPPVCEGAWPWFQWVKQDVNYFAVLRYEHSICLKEQYLSSGRNVKSILKNIKILCICHTKSLADSYKEQEML